ncbi:hypothetical protein BJ742DRAFT_676803 [Cladochytrium replicatum]|nr:hypothetical protein BJ742DRAFT_676803 [Cladochytrium replicatum]
MIYGNLLLEGYVHRSISCNHCGASPIRGFRFKCSNCVDFDLCESCEALNVHYKTHVFVKIRIPIPPLANPRNPLVPVIYPGNELEETANSYDLADLQAKTHFDHVELEAFYEQFRSLSTVDTEEGGINKETFEKCLGPLGLEKNLITERIFAFYDQDGDGIISFEELVCGLSILCKGSLDERIKYAFKGYDLDGDGYISREELRRMFKAYFRLSMELVRDVVRTMEEGMIDNFDDEATKPVSAAFSAPIPNHARSSGSDDNEDEEDHDESGENAKKMKEASAKGKKSANQSEPNGGVLLDAQRTESLDEGALMLLARDHPVPSSTSSRTPLPPGQMDEEQWPVMEAMSMEAIEEMVDRTFAAADALDKAKIDFDEFKKVVESDLNLLAWFESLGSVF